MGSAKFEVLTAQISIVMAELTTVSAFDQIEKKVSSDIFTVTACLFVFVFFSFIAVVDFIFVQSLSKTTNHN